LDEYAKNVGMSIGTNAIGNQIGNWAFGSGNNMYRVGRTIMNGSAQLIPYGFYHRKKEDE